MASKSKRTTDKPAQDLYLQLVEEREHGYYHLRGRFVTQKYETSGSQGGYVCYGVDDDYSDGLLWTGLRTGCQGDERSRARALAADAQDQPVYGFDTEYRESGDLGLRRARRMVKTLEKLDRGLEKLRDLRGSYRSYGEYVGRVAEVLGCKGIVVLAHPKRDYGQGQRWVWMSIGDGVNRANGLIEAWVDEERARQNEALPAASMREGEALLRGDE